MPTGKPDFNLNSYGIKYLSKDEVQEFLEKRTQGESIRSQGETRTRPLGTSGKPMDSGARRAGQHRGSTSSLGQGEFTPSLAGRKQIDSTINTPKPSAEKPATPTSSTISAPNAVGNKKLEGGTRSQFMSREDTTPKSHHARQLAGDIKEARGKVDESGIISSGGDQSVSATSQGKRVPVHRIKPLYGKNPDGSDKDDSKATPPSKPKAQSLGSTIGTGKQTEKKQEETEIKQNTTGKGKKGLKQLPKHTGDAPEGVKSETELVDGRNTKVGVGVKAHKKLQENPQGELTESQKPVDPNKKDKRVKDLNDQHRSSQGVQNHNTRSRENMKYYNDDQKAAYKKIPQIKNDKGKMVDDRTAQAKYHSAQEKKYGKSVSTPKKLSSAGQAIKDKLKKSNDIILDMNILKLDLMKGKKGALPAKRDIAGVGLKDSDLNSRTSQGHSEEASRTRVRGLDEDEFDNMEPLVDAKSLGKPDDGKLIKSQAAETIFKAISLKLELMKDGIQGGGKNTPKVFGSLIQEETEERKQADRSLSKFPINQTESQNARQRTYRDTKNQKDANPILDELATIDYDNPLPSGKAPKDLKTKADETILKAISLKLDMMKGFGGIEEAPKGIQGKRFVKPNMASAGKNPAVKPPNAGGIQNKLETIQNESSNTVDPEKNTETGVTGKPKGSVASQYT